MRQEPHPISGFQYQALGEGKVRVENPQTGAFGIFNWDGNWLEGDITHADPHFLEFIGGPDISPEHDVIWNRIPHAHSPEAPPESFLFGRIPEGIDRIVSKYDPAPAQETDHGVRAAGQIELSYFLDNDRKPELIPDVYRLESPMVGGPEKIATARYFEPEYHRLEVDRLWRRVWQMACRADDIPNIGDYHVYTVADLSWLIVRTGENEYKAHQNICLHRGRILRECSGTGATEFRCPYHGWSWKLDGSVKNIVAEWDFPGVRDDVSQLPGAKVGTWGGWIFINPDPDAMPLEEYLGPVMMAHYEKFDPASFWKQVHVTRPMPANWKVTMEAFMEGWHVLATHPQLLLLGYENSADRYDVFGHWGRADHVSSGRLSGHRNIFFSREEALATYRAMADGAREYHRKIIGDEVEKFSDAELNDGTYCDLFPNFHPWGGFGRINFRFRPMGNNPDKALMDVIYLAPWPKDKPKPPAAKPQNLTEEQSWCDAPQLGTLARILDQDVGNMASLQAGVRGKTPPYIWYSAYQEGKIRNFHHNYNHWLGLDDAEAC